MSGRLDITQPRDQPLLTPSQQVGGTHGAHANAAAAQRASIPFGAKKGKQPFARQNRRGELFLFGKVALAPSKPSAKLRIQISTVPTTAAMALSEKSFSSRPKTISGGKSRNCSKGGGGAYTNSSLLRSETFGPGSETSTSTIEWAMAELLRNPTKLIKVPEELDKVIGPNRAVKESDLPHLPYLHECVKEMLWLHPPVTFLLPNRAIET
ncbi:(S)-N-methylcoclaurine 3'-hydroxylase isozyme 1-like [Magnolia sinica]|uniref:(S)-N-methylcoclaurine 3'-hydroxylase isozyme 1-like n=1 Tax=Magnolia sinica TaxID=86752 RepID=UPI00265B2D61|nr:(S)-N-methylcoclaurine 3'-hydroxylase isozyme 1-like [Magnolia sinica]